MDLKCAACPADDLPWGCPGHARPHPRFCQLAKTRPEYHDVVREMCVADRSPLDQDRRIAPPVVYEWASHEPDDPRIRYGVIGAMIGCGGGERWSYDVVRAIADTHHFIGYAYESLQACENTADEARALGPLYFGPDAMRSLAEHCDVILAWGVHDLAAILPSPRVCRIVGVSQGNGYWTKMAFDSMGPIDHAVTVSHECKQFMAGWESDAQVVYNTYDPKRVFCDPIDLRSAWGIHPKERTYGYVGRFSPEKNPFAFVRFAAAMKERLGRYFQRSRFIMAGDGKGNQEEQTIELAKELGVFDRFIFPGWRGDIGNVLKAMDVMIQPSHEEGCSLALVEALAIGVPVLATSIAVALDFPDAVWPLPRDPSGEQILEVALRQYADADTTDLKRRYGLELTALDGPFGPGRFASDWRRVVADRRPSPFNASRIRELRSLIDACEHRGPKIGCGCQGRHECGLGKGDKPGEVFFHDCYRCVQETEKKTPGIFLTPA